MSADALVPPIVTVRRPQFPPCSPCAGRRLAPPRTRRARNPWTRIW
jgi:hypothetical protein